MDDPNQISQHDTDSTFSKTQEISTGIRTNQTGGHIISLHTESAPFRGSKYKIFFGIFVCVLIGVISLLLYQKIKSNSELESLTSDQIAVQTPTSEPNHTIFDAEVPTVTAPVQFSASISPIQKQNITPTLKPTPKPTPTSTPTPTPTRTPNPPIMNISYPTDYQYITQNATQTLLVVDLTAGGDTSGLQRRHNFNDQGWTSYTTLYTLALDPKEGLNRIQLQYKNQFGEESAVYTRQFNFHRAQNKSISITGEIYRDENCNGNREGSEALISTSGSVTVYLWKQPEYSIYATITASPNGLVSYGFSILDNETLTLQPSVVSPSGYKSNPNYSAPYITFSSSNTSASFSYPQVPNEYVGSCSQ